MDCCCRRADCRNDFLFERITVQSSTTTAETGLNIMLSGTDNFSVRRKLNQVQRFYQKIEADLKAKI